MKKHVPRIRILAITLVAGGLFMGGLWTGRLQADQPHMQAALSALRTARTELQKATNDKGGHRVKALEHVNAAIDQVQAGIGYDRQR